MSSRYTPLHYAILRHFADGAIDDASGVVAALSRFYGGYRLLTKEAVGEVLGIAKENGLLEEVKYELDEDDSLCIFYSASDYGRKMIERYIGDDASRCDE